MKKVTLSLILLTILSIAIEVPIATGFDYPIGNKGYGNDGQKIELDEYINDWGNDYNPKRNEEYNLGKGIYANNSRGGKSVNSSTWYNISDVGNFLNLKYTFGLHPGEDWNKGYGTNDVGEEVYAIANGKVVFLKTTYPNTTSFGWTLIIEHILPDKSKIYSVYTHITYDKNNVKGNLSSDKTKFTYQVGKIVKKGQTIGRVSSMTKMSPHLHFEIRNKFNGQLYPNDNGNGYYTHNKKKVGSITKSQVIKAFELMKKEGILDPSDFIDDHRNIDMNSPDSSPIVDGAGSLIRPEILNTSDRYRCQWGCYRDEAHMQKHSTPSIVSFQWKATNNCKKLKIGVKASKEYREKYKTWINPHNPLKVKIYTKAWNNEVITEAFKTTLPKTVDYVTGWNNIIITSQEPLSKVQKIIAECTESDDGKDVTMLNDETTIKLPLNYKFGGQSSIIRGSNKNYNKQKDGIYQDVAIGLSTNKAITLFQWQTSANCKSLVLKSGRYPNGQGISTSVNDINIKSWSDSSWSNTSCNNKLPCTINAPSSNNGKYGSYYIIKVKTNASTLYGNRISAVCN